MVCAQMFNGCCFIIGTRDEAKEGIRHIRRILDEKTAVFLQEDLNRRRVPGLERADLISVVAWTFEQSGELQRAYAGECMRFFTEFVHKLPSKYNSLQNKNDDILSGMNRYQGWSSMAEKGIKQESWSRDQYF